MNSLKPSLSEENKHRKKLEFQASSGFRQLGDPIIGPYADHQRPDPMHLEINAWEHILDLMYKEAIYIGVFQQFQHVIINCLQC